MARIRRFSKASKATGSQKSQKPQRSQGVPKIQKPNCKDVPFYFSPANPLNKPVWTKATVLDPGRLAATNSCKNTPPIIPTVSAGDTAQEPIPTQPVLLINLAAKNNSFGRTLPTPPRELHQTTRLGPWEKHIELSVWIIMAKLQKRVNWLNVIGDKCRVYPGYTLVHGKYQVCERQVRIAVVQHVTGTIPPMFPLKISQFKKYDARARRNPRAMGRVANVGI